MCVCVCVWGGVVYLYLYICEDHFEYRPYLVRTFLESEDSFAGPHLFIDLFEG